MATWEWVDFWADIAALALIALHLASIGLSSWRAWRRGRPTTLLGADATTKTIGMGVALGCSVLGAYTAFFVLAPLHMPVPALFGVQLGMAFLFALWASRLYERWLSQPIFRWFAGEGVTQGG